VRGPNVGPGYTDPRRNAGTFDAGWLSTGDIGSVDGEGRVFVTGRAKDLIIRSGHNIEPGLIEDALMRHPDVQFAAAVGAPDAYAGEVPVAYVVLGPGAEVDVGALSQFLAQHVHEPPAMPKWIEALPALPLTAVGKVYKPQLRVRAMERAIGERLCGSSLAGSVTIRGLDLASGPCLEFEPVSGGDRSLLDVDVRAFMAPYAIAWRWAQASGAGPDHAPPSPASGDPASLT
jgi:fatty-acyl-CoA synthase